MSNKRMILGFHAINARLWQNPKSLYEIYLAENKNDQRSEELLAKAQAENISVYRVNAERIHSLTGGNQKHQGVVAFIDASKVFTDIEEVLENLTEPPFLLILDNITDPHNLGACLRVADAMGVHAVIAPRDKSVGLNATVSKVACGAAETVPYITVTNLARAMKMLKEKNIWLYGTTMNAPETLYNISIPTGMAWVMGSEGQGLRRLTIENCDVLVSIPMYGQVESLNVSVSTGIVLAETRRQFSLHNN